MSENKKSEEKAPELTQTCPRRMNEAGPWDAKEGLDHWRVNKHNMAKGELHCSFCGSLKPDIFMERLKDGYKLIPTDKNYKAYLCDKDGRQDTKFYYQHLSSEQKGEFIDLYNARTMVIDHPGYLYTLPYFCSKLPPAANA